MRPTVRSSRLERASSVSEKTSPEPLDLGGVVAGDQDTRRRPAALSSSALTLASSPENRSTLSIRRWQVVSSESAAERRDRDRRKADQPLEAALDA